MTPERKRSILVISITFILGIAIGVLATGLMARKHYRNRPEVTIEQRTKQKESFVNKLLRVIDATEQQQAALKPLIETYVHRIDSVQENQKSKTRSLFQELQEKIRPQVSDEQYQRLQNFNAKVINHTPRDSRHRHR